jgi:hypothetical protein
MEGHIKRIIKEIYVDVEQTELVGSGRRGDELACSMNS